MCAAAAPRHLSERRKGVVVLRRRAHLRRQGTQFTCFTRTEVQILTQKALKCFAAARTCGCKVLNLLALLVVQKHKY